MSNAPSGWQAPRTNWATTDPITTTDLNRIEGNANATELGGRTLDQTLASPANVGTLRQILSWFAGRIRAITGATNWFDTPATTLAAAHAHHTSRHIPRQLYAGDETVVSATGSEGITRKSMRVIRSTANGADVSSISVVAELWTAWGVGSLDIFVNDSFLFPLTTTSTTPALVQGSATVSWADNTVNLVEMRLRHTTNGTVHNRVFELYV